MNYSYSDCHFFQSDDNNNNNNDNNNNNNDNNNVNGFKNVFGNVVQDTLNSHTLSSSLDSYSFHKSKWIQEN